MVRVFCDCDLWREIQEFREEEMEEKDNQNPNNSSSSSFVIKIPLYEEVIQSSQSKTPPQSLFNPSSFSQAFNSIKNTEFYAPPPPPPPSSSSLPRSLSSLINAFSSLRFWLMFHKIRALFFCQGNSAIWG